MMKFHSRSIIDHNIIDIPICTEKKAYGAAQEQNDDSSGIVPFVLGCLRYRMKGYVAILG